MPVSRVVKCDICGCEETEVSHGVGWMGWLNIKGFILDGNPDVWICPSEMPKVAEYIDQLKHGKIKLIS